MSCSHARWLAGRIVTHIPLHLISSNLLSLTQLDNPISEPSIALQRLSGEVAVRRSQEGVRAMRGM